MSRTKFLGIPEGGKRAGWIEMEGGSSAGGGCLLVTVTKSDTGENLFVADKTYAEIAAALDAGVNVLMLSVSNGSTTYLHPTFKNDEGVTFGNVMNVTGDNYAVMKIDIWADNTIIVKMAMFTAQTPGA